MQAVSLPVDPDPDEADDVSGAELELVSPPAVGAGLVLPPPLLLLPQADNASVTAATPAITALVRRPRTMIVLSNIGAMTSPTLSYLRHGIDARKGRKGLGSPDRPVVTGSLRDPGGDTW